MPILTPITINQSLLTTELTLSPLQSVLKRDVLPIEHFLPKFFSSVLAHLHSSCVFASCFWTPSDTTSPELMAFAGVAEDVYHQDCHEKPCCRADEIEGV